jgi:hypothetical protein
VALTQDEMLKHLTLDLDGIPKAKWDEVKDEVASYIKEQMLVDFSDAISPVTGRKFKALSKDYKEYKSTQSSSVIPNMELGGDMLDALDAVSGKGSRVTVGWTDPVESAKAFNHTTGDTLPKRPLLPGPKENFRSEIMDGIAAILDEYRAD